MNTDRLARLYAEAIIASPIVSTPEPSDTLFDMSVPLEVTKRAAPPGPWKAIHEIWGLDWNVKGQRARLGKLARDYKEVGGNTEEIHARYKRYRQEWPNMECTPEGLLIHWQRFGPERKAAPSESTDECERDLPDPHVADPDFASDHVDRFRQLPAPPGLGSGTGAAR